MRYKVLYVLLWAEAAACVLLRIMQTSLSSVFSAAMAFPFEQIGLGLRVLSLSGAVGNVAAIVIYALINISPAVLLLVLRNRRGLYSEDGLLGLLSALLFAVMYLMINPGIISSLTGGAAGQPIGKAVLGGGTIYSILCGYIVLRALRLFFSDAASELACYSEIMLGLLGMIFVYLTLGVCFSSLLDSIAALRTSNSGNEHLLGPSYVFLALQFIVDALPFVLDVFVVFAALRLLSQWRIDRYSAETVGATGRMSRLCALSLAVMVLSNIGFNLLQLLFVKFLRVINISVKIPVLSIAFVLAALLIVRFVTENKQLKDDNDMFI